MNAQETSASATPDQLPNGPGAAAILAAGLGCFSVGIFAILADVFPAFKQFTVFYRPTGPLSGVTTLAIVLWLFVWAILNYRWKRKSVNLSRVSLAALVLLALSLLLTFPPIADLF